MGNGRAYPAVVDDTPADLEMVAGLLALKLLKLFEDDVASTANVTAARAACEETRHLLTIMVKHRHMSADERGLPEYRSALDLVIKRATAILDGSATPDDLRGYPHAVLAVAQWAVPRVPGQGERLN
jgi:hypothetical protein